MKKWITAAILLVFITSACKRANSEATLQPTFLASPSQAAFEVIPALPAPAYPAPKPSEDPTLLPPSASQPAEALKNQKVTFYLVALGDDGFSGRKIGCGDSLVPVQVQVPETKAVLRASLQALLVEKQPYYGESGLYNALYQSDLLIEDVNIKDGTAVIRLVGKVQLGGVCDNPRFEEQLKATALQFNPVSRVVITINGTALEEFLSLK